MHWILVYNALFFFDFLFNRIVPNLYISNAGLGTRKKSNDSYYRLTFFYFQENPPKTSHFHSVTICHSWYAKKSA